jgi:phosphate/sulfate permease
MHDVANIAVYLPRELSVMQLLIVIIYFTILLFYIFKIHGGRIQKVVLDKTGTRYARSATIINIIYAVVLYYFKELNDLPMSTTWVFVGLLCGRELAISTMNKDYKFKYVFPLIGKDFIKMIFGLSVSVGIVLAIHYIIIPNEYF